MAQALDEFFAKSARFPGTALPNPFYWAGNEPDILAPWLGSLIGRPDLTAKYTRWVLYTYYESALPDSLPGNDDFGTLSSWAVWAWLGFYPLSGTDTYTLLHHIHTYSH
jgi:putative alpha-1,2-mannosidase